MEQAEPSQQPLKPEAVWQHGPPASDGPPAADPSASASSAFSPAQIPYTDSNTLALLQSWYAYYAQQHRALQSAHAQSGVPDGGFHPTGPNDPALAGAAALLKPFVCALCLSWSPAMLPTAASSCTGCLTLAQTWCSSKRLPDGCGFIACAATIPHILSSLAPRPDGSTAGAIPHGTPGPSGPGTSQPQAASGLSAPPQGHLQANGLLRRPTAAEGLEQSAAGVRYVSFESCCLRSASALL